jgi:hypothetical protein
VRIIVSLIAMTGVILCLGCQRRSIDIGMPSQISSRLTTPFPTETESPTANPTQASSPLVPVVPILTFNPQEVPETPTMNDIPISAPFYPALEKIILLVKADLAERLSMDPRYIEVVEVASVTWPDGGLGCGKPGVEYLQVLIPGYKILLMADGRIYTYHSDTLNQIVLCT